MALIYIVEDDNNISEIESFALKNSGFHVEEFPDAKAFFERLDEKLPNLILLDVMLPDEDGLSIVSKLRKRSDTRKLPVIMVTAKTTEIDKVKGLDLGADDYLAKPFDTRELLACVNALLRRQGSQVDELIFGNTSLDLSSGTLICGKENIRLSAKEFEVMRLLLQNPSRNLSKETILAHVWGYDSNAVENHVEVYVGFLRKKLSAIRSNVAIVAIRRLGYHLEVTTP